MIIVTVTRPRPDFRVFSDLLFGPDRNIDSDGDAAPVYSRNWRDLYLRDRESGTPQIEIFAQDTLPLRFEVSSESSRLEELAAIYLFIYCGEAIEQNDKALTATRLQALKAEYARELKRAEASIWHHSSADHPYPNLSKAKKV